jgi:nicotinate-nucleotide pyrophosphorylase (carboxylating)
MQQDSGRNPESFASQSNVTDCAVRLVRTAEQRAGSQVVILFGRSWQDCQPAGHQIVERIGYYEAAHTERTMSKEFHQHAWDADLEDDCRRLIRLAVREDLDRQQDWTSVALVPQGARGSATVIARESGVVAGLRAVEVLLDEMNSQVTWQPAVEDGDAVLAGMMLAALDGAARDMLTCERPLLNLMGRLSGIASLTAQYVAAVDGTPARIYDTRKTAAGWRRLEKYAVRCGGGCNHRTGLYDAVMIKDNHLAFLAESTADDVTGPSAPTAKQARPAEAIRQVREFLLALPGDRDFSKAIIEVEVDSLDQFADLLLTAPQSKHATASISLSEGTLATPRSVNELPDIVLLDNMDVASLRRAVAIRDAMAPSVELEASGGVTLETVRAIAEAGVERISVGAVTHSARCFDVGLDWHG